MRYFKMVIHQAMGLPATRSTEALAFLKSFIEEMKAFGFISQETRPQDRVSGKERRRGLPHAFLALRTCAGSTHPATAKSALTRQVG